MTEGSVQFPCLSFVSGLCSACLDRSSAIFFCSLIAPQGRLALNTELWVWRLLMPYSCHCNIFVGPPLVQAAPTLVYPYRQRAPDDELALTFRFLQQKESRVIVLLSFCRYQLLRPWVLYLNNALSSQGVRDRQLHLSDCQPSLLLIPPHCLSRLNLSENPISNYLIEYSRKKRAREHGQ